MHVGSNYWLTIWTSRSEDTDPKFYGLLACGYAVMCLIRAAIIDFRAVRSSGSIHYQMIEAVMNASLPKFFDRVPIGRLLNRFSKNLNTVDITIPPSWGNAIVSVYILLVEIGSCVVTSPYVLLPLVLIFLFFSGVVQRSFVSLNREIVRLGNAFL